MKKYLVLIFCFIISLPLLSVYAQSEVICENIGNFKEGLAPIMLNSKWGFIDEKGKTVIEPKFVAQVENINDLPGFSNGLVAIMDPETEYCGYIDQKGELKIPCKYFSSTVFSECKAFVKTPDGVYIIDSKGNILNKEAINPSDFHSRFSDSLACKQKGNCLGYINKYGEFVIDALYEYDGARDFSEGLAAVKKENKWGYIGKDGGVKIPFNFSNEPRSFCSGRAFVLSKDNTYGLIDATGKVLVEPVYKQVFDFNDGAAVVSKMGPDFLVTYYIIDVNGKVIKAFAAQKSSLETIIFNTGFSEGLAVATKGVKKGCIDSKGKVAINFLYNEIKPFSGGLAYAERPDEKTGKNICGFLNKKGEMVFTVKQPQF